VLDESFQWLVVKLTYSIKHKHIPFLRAFRLLFKRRRLEKIITDKGEKKTVNWPILWVGLRFRFSFLQKIYRDGFLFFKMVFCGIKIHFMLPDTRIVPVNKLLKPQGILEELRVLPAIPVLRLVA